MIGKLIMGIVGMTLLMILWVIVQDVWRNAFADQIDEDDVLAIRSRCGNCGCSGICQNKNEETVTTI